MTQPLSGIKVIDFTHVLAGPACSYYLGLLGAEVIKVESSERGDGMRYRGGSDAERSAAGMSTAYLAQGAGKRSISLDLTEKKGRETMMHLLKTADVFVENHLPQTMRRLELDETFTRNNNPSLIHCSMTGYGRGGDQENSPAYDVNIQAACGIMTLTGTTETGPLRTGAPIMDYGVALAACFAITSALLHREKSGEGSFIDVSMLETGLTLMTSTIVDLLCTGNHPKPRGNAANSRSPVAGNFQCKSGILSLGVNEEAQFRRLAIALDNEQWLSDPRYSTRQKRLEHSEDFAIELTQALKTRTAAEWETLLLSHQVPASMLRTLPECLSMELVAERQYLHETPDGITVPTLPFRINHASNHRPAGTIPTHGEHTDQILQELAADHIPVNS